MISVFRAQGALEDNTKKLLEELRAVLHISHDRHSAEARRVANDEILATIAEQLAGPNTGLGWILRREKKALNTASPQYLMSLVCQMVLTLMTPSLQAQAAPIPKLLNTKPCHLIIKKRGEIVTDTKPSSDIKVLQKLLKP
ncbi:BRCA2-interacting transcriptional repressor EMSY [Eumeta japonica]|uniref:BRCA2-interacting transcriptional repressor EMSY n=1 Tax=Eumeta variegata TaxID=151549 RepID=A0A4C1Z327_EUMVA|nr:BRCA2-interacting transcriptional repressor EMSY [Eumeta japonica]